LNEPDRSDAALGERRLGPELQRSPDALAAAQQLATNACWRVVVSGAACPGIGA